MPSKSNLCPENNNYSQSNGYANGKRMADSVNWEPTPTLALGGLGYVVVCQYNCNVDYNIPLAGGKSRKVSSPRFWGVRLDENDIPVEIRSISQSSLMGRYVSLRESMEDVAPTFPVNVNAEGFKRAVLTADQQNDAIPGSHRSFLKAVKVENAETGVEEWRGIIHTPVIITPIRRNGAFVIGYEDRAEGASSAHVKTNAEGNAVCDVNPRFYTFADVKTPTQKQVDVALAALKEMADADHFYEYLGEE